MFISVSSLSIEYIIVEYLSLSRVYYCSHRYKNMHSAD